MTKRAKIRLYVDQPLHEGNRIELTRDQAHYLFGVMRQNEGGLIAVFNGTDGEWNAQITQSGKRGGALECRAQTLVQRNPPDLWLVFAPIKKARTDFIVEKAVEMGVRRLLPVQTEFTNSERIRQDRLQAHAIEAAEQCGATFVPEVAALMKLPALLQGWPEGRHLIFCDEAAAGGSSALQGLQTGASAILIGPEGGFSDAERTRLIARPEAVRIALGPRILRADTAAVAALTLWQVSVGDWQ